MALSRAQSRKRQRMMVVGLVLLAVGGAAALMTTAFEESIVFFFSPTELVENDTPDPGQRLRVGGLIEEGSVVKSNGGMTVAFNVTDLANTVPVIFSGLLPDLFREGQGVVAEGYFRPDGVFAADEVLAKHDENYMPREVEDALKKSGQWKGAEGAGS